jgi:hypothetical protein
LALRVVGLFAFIGLLNFSYRYLDDLTRGRTGTFHARFIEEFTGVAGAALLFPLLLRGVRRWPLTGERWYQRLPIHLAILMAASLVLTTWMWASRTALYALLGLGRYDYGIMSIRYPMEFPNHVLGYALMVGLVTMIDQYRAARQREVHTARLESELAQAQLHNLRLQLNPHFLFNALNTVASVMYEDPARADRMLTGLSELLRLTLRDTPAQEATLTQELGILERYLDIQRARFEARLEVSTDADSETLSALVPQLLLQPLVENAVRHGVGPDGRARIAIAARRENGSLLVTVRDHGPGLRGSSAEALQRGVGLATTASRLERLYGDGQRLQLLPALGGGLEVRVMMPFRTAG